MRSVRLNFEAAQLAVHRKPSSPKHSFLHFPQAKCRTFLSSAAWQYAFQLGSWLGHRLLVAKDKEKKNYRRENLETNCIFIFACYLLVCSLLFSFIVRNELKKKNPREGTGPSPTRNIYLAVPNIFNGNAQTAACQPPNGRPVDSE